MAREKQKMFLSFDNQIYPFVDRSNSSVHSINWYTLQCCLDSS